MEIKRLVRGPGEEALVEADSQAEREMRAIGFTERGRADGPGSHKPGEGGATPSPATTSKPEPKPKKTVKRKARR